MQNDEEWTPEKIAKLKEIVSLPRNQILMVRALAQLRNDDALEESASITVKAVAQAGNDRWRCN